MMIVIIIFSTTYWVMVVEYITKMIKEKLNWGNVYKLPYTLVYRFWEVLGKYLHLEQGQESRMENRKFD